MNPLGLFARGTPSAGTADASAARGVSDGRSSRAVLNALAQLVDRLTELAAIPSTAGIPYDTAFVAVRDALRQLAARSREGLMLCRVQDDTLLIDGAPLAASIMRASPTDEAMLRLTTQVNGLGIGSITVREGAAPGELLTLARLLARQRVVEAPRSSNDSETPTMVAAFGGDPFADEILRTWSVLVTPVALTRAHVTGTLAPSSALARLAAARTDDATSSAVRMLMDVLDDAEVRGDAGVIEGIANALMARLRVVGSGAGRTAIEGGIRQLLRPGALDLLARCLPRSTDRGTLLQLFARAGDAGVETLIGHLLIADDAVGRRAFFDGIVAIDVGSLMLFELLRDSRWYVVRNAAALLGEMGVEHADSAMLPLLTHSDDRIRIAVARALMRLRTPKALQALHAKIDDPTAEVRRLSAAAFGLAGGAGSGLRPPAARLSAALENENDEDVALEMLAALGRLGSADAVQRLLRIAIPTSQELAAGSQRDSWVRVAALEALVRARGHAMLLVIETLLTDADPAVSAAASRLRDTVTS